MPRALKVALSSLLVGVMSLGFAYAGTVIAPGKKAVPVDAIGAKGSATDAVKQAPSSVVAQAQTSNAVGPTGTPPQGQVLAGASAISLEPRPQDYDGTWVRTMDECRTFSTDGLPKLDHAAAAGSPWPENPDCIYMGGFDIGPANPVIAWDEEDPDNPTPWRCTEPAFDAEGKPDGAHSFIECGVYVRSFAVKGPNGKTLTLTIIDGEGYLWDYASKCDDCGIKQITAELAADPDLGLEAAAIQIGATHTHSGPEFLGGWGFVPDWYMDQVTDSIKQSVRDAVNSMEPAVLEVGEELARPYNSERRDTYRSAEEQELTWIRAISTDVPGNPKHTIATVGAYAAHPTTKGTNNGIASSDWVGPFEHRLEERFGGVGLFFMTGLGNMSASGGRGLGVPLADLIPEVGEGLPLTKTDVSYARTTWNQPATNVPLTGLGAPGFFDRKFVESPSQVRTGKSPDTAPCESASAVSVELPASAARIGDMFALTTSPGEIFANISNTIKEKSGAAVTMPIAQTNDALGYMPQSIEMSPIGQQGLGFFFGGVLIVNYEDSYAIDRCTGDMVLEQDIALLNGLSR